MAGYHGIAFATQASERMRINSSGNVGIGLHRPQAKPTLKAVCSQLSTHHHQQGHVSSISTVKIILKPLLVLTTKVIFLLVRLLRLITKAVLAKSYASTVQESCSLGQLPQLEGQVRVTLLLSLLEILIMQ